MSGSKPRIGIFGWGLVAPGAESIDAFSSALAEPRSYMSKFEGFGPSNFLVGQPDFDFSAYKEWIAERFPPNRFRSLAKKMGTPTLYAIGAFIQALRQNEGIEHVLSELGSQAQVILGAGLNDIPTYRRVSIGYYIAQRRWDRFWADPSRNAVHAAHLAGETPVEGVPPLPDSVATVDRDVAEDAYWRFWTERSVELPSYLEKLREIEASDVQGAVEAGKAAAMKRKRSAYMALKKEWGAPDTPWDGVSPDALWNICNTPASQVSMLGKITGMCYAPYAACSAFGYSLKLGMEAIRRGEAKVVVVGASEPAPDAVSVGTFYTARVLSNDGEVSKPLTGLRGTHVAGGSCVWIIADMNWARERGFKPLGMEPIAVGVSADADHIITPSVEGPLAAIDSAFDQSGLDPKDVRDWDLHATGTPGDYLEVHTALMRLSDQARITARKGSLGHGMGAGGGWELTAQYLGYVRGSIFPTTLDQSEINPEIAKEGATFVMGEPCAADGELVGKLSMGVGGINACILSKPLRD